MVGRHTADMRTLPSRNHYSHAKSTFKKLQRFDDLNLYRFAHSGKKREREFGSILTHYSCAVQAKLWICRYAGTHSYVKPFRRIDYIDASASTFTDDPGDCRWIATDGYHGEGRWMRRGERFRGSTSICCHWHCWHNCEVFVCFSSYSLVAWLKFFTLP